MGGARFRRWVLLDDAPEIHHQRALAEVAHQSEVVRDINGGQPHGITHFAASGEDSGAHADVEHRHRLIGDQEARRQHQRTSQHDALQLSATQLVRIAVEVAFTVGEMDAAEGLLDAVGMLRLVDAGIDQRLGDGAIDGEAWVERVERILEDKLGWRRKPRSSSPARSASAAPSKEIVPAVGSMSFSIRRRAGLAAARLAHNRYGVARTDVKAYAVECVHGRPLAAHDLRPASASPEVLYDVAKFDERAMSRDPVRTDGGKRPRCRAGRREVSVVGAAGDQDRLCRASGHGERAARREATAGQLFTQVGRAAVDRHELERVGQQIGEGVAQAIV